MVDKKKDAIFRMEKKDGKLYRVMYFKNNKGGFTRSKFIREVQPKVKTGKGKRGRPRKVEQPVQVQQTQSQTPTPRQSITKIPQRNIPVSTQRVPHRHIKKKPAKAAHRYVKPSGSSQVMINKWVNLARKKQ